MSVDQSRRVQTLGMRARSAEVGIVQTVRSLFGSASEDEAIPQVQPRAVVAQQSRLRSQKGPSFQTSATDRGGGRSTATRLRLREAFMPSQPVVSRNLFAGRERLLERIIGYIEDQRSHVVLYGERGIGKTSLLRVLVELAKDANYFIAQESCGAGTDFDQLARSILRQLPIYYYGALSLVEAQGREGQTFNDVVGEGPVTSTELSRVLSNFTGTRLLIVLDEFDRVPPGKFQLHVAELIKNLSDASARVQIVIGGVADNLVQLLGHAPSIRRNVAAVPVEEMGPQEVRQLVELGEAHIGLKFDSEAIAYVIAIAHGRPHLARLLCHASGLQACSESRTNVTLPDVRNALVGLSTEIEGRLSRNTTAVLGQCIAADKPAMLRIALAALARGGRFEQQDFAEDFESGSIDQLLTKLKGAGVLNLVGDTGQGSYEFNDESAPTYILLQTFRR